MAPDTGAALVSIGERLRGARKCRPHARADGGASGLSKAHLSRLESAERQPSIAALLLAAPGHAVSALLGEGDGRAGHLHRPGRRAREGLAIASCSGYPGSTALEALRITVEPDRAPARPVTGARSGSTSCTGSCASSTTARSTISVPA